MQNKFIYAMTSCGFTKVGISSDPESRAKAINTPDEIVTWSTNYKYKNPYEIEKHCHKTLADKSVKGEWFDCTQEEAIEAIELSCNLVGEICDGSANTEDLNAGEAISLIFNEDLIPGTLLRRNPEHRAIYAELISTHNIDWISESELRMLITDDKLFEEIKTRLKESTHKPKQVDFV